MSDVNPGSWVEAQRDLEPKDGFQGVQAGCAYQVSHFVKIDPGGCACDLCGARGPFGLVLVGDRPNQDGYGWCPCSFAATALAVSGEGQ